MVVVVGVVVEVSIVSVSAVHSGNMFRVTWVFCKKTIFRLFVLYLTGVGDGGKRRENKEVNKGKEDCKEERRDRIERT